MGAHRHTLAVLVEGYDTLQVTHDLSLTPRQIDAKKERGYPAPTIVDFPNWEDVAESCDLLAIADDGEINGALPKPSFPLTDAVFDNIPIDLGKYLTSMTAVGDALVDYHAKRLPFSRKA